MRFYPSACASLCLALTMVLLGCASTGQTEPEMAVTEETVDPGSNLFVGVHAISCSYQFTDETCLIEVARELESMGASIIKFRAGPRYTRRPHFLEEVDGVNSLRTLLELHPVYQEVLGMPFRDYFFWGMPFGDVNWTDRIDETEAAILYRETYDLAEYLLTSFSGTGKVFHMGHWEGDWLLLPGRDPNATPSADRLVGFTQFLQIRQTAINDARENVPHHDVNFYHYAEVNLVMKGVDRERATLTNTVLPRVDIDYVSYSSYDTIQGDNMEEQVLIALNHIEEMMVPRPDWPGKRVYAGEMAIRASLVDFDPEEHDRRNRAVIRTFLEWGCPYILYWQMYCNEVRDDLPQGYNGFWLIDPEGTRYPLYHTFADYWQVARLYADEIEAETGQTPSDEQMRAFAIDYFTP